MYVVEGPQAAPLDPDYAGVAQLLEVMRERGLGDVEQRDELAHADPARVLAEHVDELDADRVGQRAGDGGEAIGIARSDIRVHERLTARLARRSLALGLHD
jgi:hypothetical protein